MNMLNVTFCGKKSKQVEYGTVAASLLDEFEEKRETIVAVRINNEVCPLDREIEYDCYIEPVLLNSKDGVLVYRRSLCLLLAAACHKIYPTERLVVGHSLGYGYYYTLEHPSPLTVEEISSLEKEMWNIVNQDLPIETRFVSYSSACKIFEELGLNETRKQLNYLAPPKIRINSIGDFADMYFGPLMERTGTLKVFELMPYKKGFLLRFPKSSDSTKLSEFVDEPKLFEIYERYKNWGKQLNVTSAASLNQMINERKIDDFIMVAESLQVHCISKIAEEIVNRKGVRVVLLAGPSSSGKTTTSKKLAMQIQALGYTPKVISLDCYYAGRDKTPLDADGKPDYECLEALDVELLNKNLVDLFDGKEVNIPSYDFHDGKPYFEEKNKMTLKENEILIMEGIHGLNDRLTPKIPKECKFKVYLSALTQLNLDDHNRISTSDNRLIRRIVRDARFRGKGAAGTIAMWPSVQRGEQLHIFPFQNNADAILNTALDYELAVLKIYAEPLLRCVNPSQKEYSEACRLLNFLSNFAPIPPTSVPNRSIIREFIGGSAFKY